MSQAILAVFENFDDPSAELYRLLDGLKITQVLSKIKSQENPNTTLQEAEKILNTIADLFSVSVPQETDPLNTLKNIARNYQWSRLLREKALAGLYRLVHVQKTQDQLPVWTIFTNPTTLAPFRDETEFIIWFCKEAALTQATVFIRLGTYRKLQGLGYSLDEAFKIVLSKPFVIRNALNSLATWSKGTIIDVDPDTVVRVAEQLQSPSGELITDMAEEYKKDPSPANLNALIQQYEPILKDAIEEVSAIPNSKDASKFINQDLGGKPAITYTIEEGGVLIITVIQDSIDLTKGYPIPEQAVIRIPMVPQTSFGIPVIALEDLLERLPIANRRQAEAYILRVKSGQIPDSPF